MISTSQCNVINKSQSVASLDGADTGNLINTSLKPEIECIDPKNELGPGKGNFVDSSESLRKRSVRSVNAIFQGDLVKKSFDDIGFDRAKFDLCSAEQKNYICQYGSQMLKNGYKSSFTKEVCNSMAELYQYRNKANESIENVLSAAKSDIVDSCDSRNAFLRKVDDYLGEYMKDHEGSNRILYKCFSGQSQSTSSEAGLVFQGFCLSTRANLDKENYFFNSLPRKDFWGNDRNIPDTAEGLIKHFEEFFDKEDPYRELNYGKNCNKEVYSKTMVINRALVAIALNHIDNPKLNLDKEKKEITVYRSMNDYHAGHLAGIMRSTSLGPDYYDPKYIGGKEYSVVKMSIPFSDVEGAFFLNMGMWFDEREVICNTINAKVIEVKDVVKK